ARQKNLPRAEFFRLCGPLNRIASNTAPATVRVNFPTTFRAPACIDRDDNALTAESFSTRTDQLRILDRGGVERDLVGTGAQNRANVFDRPQTSTDCERNEYLIRYA